MCLVGLNYLNKNQILADVKNDKKIWSTVNIYYESISTSITTSIVSTSMQVNTMGSGIHKTTRKSHTMMWNASMAKHTVHIYGIDARLW